MCEVGTNKNYICASIYCNRQPPARRAGGVALPPHRIRWGVSPPPTNSKQNFCKIIYKHRQNQKQGKSFLFFKIFACTHIIPHSFPCKKLALPSPSNSLSLIFGLPTRFLLRSLVRHICLHALSFIKSKTFSLVFSFACLLVQAFLLSQKHRSKKKCYLTVASNHLTHSVVAIFFSLLKNSQKTAILPYGNKR